MSNSVALNVHPAISSASVVGSMRATIAATPTTSVHLIADSVKMISHAVHGTTSYLYLVYLLKKAQRRSSWEAYVGGICVMVMPRSDRHYIVALSQLTCAASLASSREDEVAWKTVQR